MKIKNITVQDFFAGVGKSACATGRQWATENCKTLKDVWEKCERGDWLWWLLSRYDVDQRTATLFAVACAESVLPI